MRAFALCLALCAFACDSDDPHREVVDLVDTSNDPSTASDSGSADGGGGIVGAIPSGGSSNNGSRMDASLSDATIADSSIPADAGGSPYACETNNDCVIRDVGNCCGYYPRCANANAIFTPPDCSGGTVGVCGFPAIDSCSCRQNLCRSLQAGVEL